ncbi:CYTH and CHAD domain-containing protein [Thiobacillus sp.]|uniref:CYTH and CHAD domain-containing protein n=1 Tax=Thiobacillus sp. TaxID=924 RepID=UPI0025CFBEF7|nr:CYTH and CHAD domain-containing protein [Thiobacillus sp.]
MTTPHPMEIELKLALPPQQAAAFVKRMARRRSVPLQQDLVTRYFDTPDFALSAQGVALRVRRVGRRWLQTLKTEGERQGGLSRRVEFEMPVSRGVPDWSRFPPEALAYVPEALRAQLAPVFETRFHRTAWLIAGKGGAQVEVALDVGEVVSGERSQPICEIELELKAGQPDALFVLALDWAVAFDCLPFDVSKAERGVRLAHGIGAAPVKSVSLALDDGMGVEAGFAAIVQTCLAQFQANLPGVRASDDIEYVHQARVALRRLRAALRLFRTACALPPGLLDELRALAATLGPARDWDVLCGETLPAIAPHYPDAESWQQGMAALEARRSAVRAGMREALAQAHPGAWLLAMQRWLLRHGWHAHPEGQAVPAAQRFIQLSPLDAWVRRALQKGHRPIVRGARDFAALTPAQRHALRIAIKRQRYAAEFFQTLFDGRRQAGYLAALRTAQDSLGQANDAHIASGLLTAAGREAGAMGDFALGWLAAKQADVADGECAESIRAFLKSKPYW